MLGLKAPTDPAWARVAATDLDAVLVDHAHCEMKAASNAMALVVRHADRRALTTKLLALVREELDHFERVVAFLDARGLALGAPPVDAYAADLRRAASTLPHVPAAGAGLALVDRLLVGALIEARSCERFKLLLDVLEGGSEDAALVGFYRELFECEARHYRTYVDLACEAAAGDRAFVEARLERLAELEAAIVTRLGAAPAPAASRAAVHG